MSLISFYTALTCGSIKTDDNKNKTEKEFSTEQSNNSELETQIDFYNQQQMLFYQNNPIYSSMYENMGLSLSNSRTSRPYKKYKVGSNATTLKKAYDKTNGQKLAVIARQTANEMTASRTNNNDYYCARGVGKTLQKAGLTEGSLGDAHLCASALENNKNFKEIKVSRKDLKNLPAGCIVVYNRKEYGTSATDVYGHIAITLGNGQEASDRIRDIKDRNNEYRVFVWSSKG